MSSLLVFNRVYRLKIQSVMFVRPCNLLTGSPTPPPHTVWISTGVSIHTVCNGEGLDQSGASYRLTPAAKYLYWSIFKKSRHFAFGVFIYIWSMTYLISPGISIWIASTCPASAEPYNWAINPPLKKTFFLKGTQEWKFFWLRFWILYYFIVSYA